MVLESILQNSFPFKRKVKSNNASFITFTTDVQKRKSAKILILIMFIQHTNKSKNYPCNEKESEENSNNGFSGTVCLAIS